MLLIENVEFIRSCQHCKHKNCAGISCLTSLFWLSDLFLFSAFFLIGKKTLMLSPCLSVCLSVNQFSREPWNTQNQYFHHRSVYTSPGNYLNLVYFWQCVRIKFVKNHDKTLKTSLHGWWYHAFTFIIQRSLYCVYLYTTPMRMYCVYASNRCDRNSMRPATEWISQNFQHC